MFALACAATLRATTIDVFQAGKLKGSIEAFSGANSAIDNYDFFSHSAHPAEGPNLRLNRGAVFFYDGPEGTTFNVIFNKEREPGEPVTTGLVSWNILVASLSDASVILSDDKPELTETNPNIFKGRWEWRNNTDGGILNGLELPIWAVLVDPKQYLGLDTLRAFSADGSRINLNLATGARGNMIFALHVPEGGSTLALIAPAFAGLAWLSRRKTGGANGS